MNKTNKTEAHRHHYIPQFIIRNFDSNGMGFVKYYDKKRKQILTIPTEDVFAYFDLYRDEKNLPYDPTKVEKDFAKYEGEMSKVIKKMLVGDSFELSSKDNEALLLFLALMQFRSKNALNSFSEKAKEETKAFYSNYQKDGDLTDLWKRNLGQIVNCRSIAEVIDNPKIDMPIKTFMIRDSFGLAGMYIVVAERRGNEDFFLSDAYPLVQFGVADNNLSLPIWSFFPISPKRVILSVYNGIEAARQDIRVFSKEFFAKPYVLNDHQTIRFKVRKMYENDIKNINDSIFQWTREGVVFSDEDKFFVAERRVQ